MRLIDADDFMKFMTALEEHGAEHVSFDDLRKFISEQQTVYDINSVVGELERMRDAITHNISLNSQGDDVDGEILNEISHYQRIIKVVKSGGIK